MIKNQNPIELLFKDLKHFDKQNPVTGNLIPEVDIGKKKDLSKFLSHAPDVKDLELQSRLNKLRSRNEFFNSGDDNNINNFSFILPSPPPQLPQPPYVPPPLPFQLPNLSDLFSKNRPPLPPLLPPPPTRQPPNLSFFNNEQTSIFLTPPALANQHGDKYNANNVQRQANDVTFFLPKVPTILDDDKYEKKKEIKKQEDDEIKEEINLQKLTDKINQGNIPSELEFYFGGFN